MFQISDSMILNACNPVVFKQGAEYYRMKRIKSIQFNQERLSFDASVLGREQYNVSILFNRDGTMSRAVCSCPDFEEDRMLCGHIVSVLFLIREKDEQGFFSELRFRQAARQIFGFFQNIPNILKKRLELETTFEFNSSGILSSGAYSALSFRIGEDRLYALKNIKSFFESMEENNEVRLGKNFTFDPACHDFKDEDRPVINFVKELYEAEKLAGRFTGGYNHGTVFRNRIVCLPSSGVKRFFEIVGDKPFRAQIQGKLYENMTVLNSDFPVEFHLAKDGKDLVLSIDFEGSIMPLTDDGEYFLAGDRIYKTTKKQQENFKPFYMAMMYIKGRKLRFLEEDRDKFVSEVFPFANKVGKVIIDENVQSLIEKCDLNAEIYLDRDGVTITADIRFKYKDRAINPFSPLEKQHTSEKILIRDVENERIILDILGEAEFKVRNNQIYLDDEDKIFDLVNDILPRLQEYASIYYSESFKNVVIRHMPSFSGSIGFNTGNDMLEFSFDIDGIAHEELEEVLLSLKDRKKFFRLKDGSYLPLNTKQFKELSDIVDCLDAGLGDFRQGVLQIPKFRSLYLNSYLKESGIYYIERNQAFKEFVQNILEPSDMNFKVPWELKGILRDYQKLGFKWLKTLSAYGLGGILADDMGLGKTLQVLALILSDMQEKGRQPSLVIVPTSLIFNWCAEVEKFAPGLKVIAVTGSRVERSALRENISEADLVITSYPLIRRDIEEYKSINFRYCILDEAQHIKNPGSQNASSVKEINSGVRFALTGTPIENSLSELWSIFDFVIPGYLYSYQRFARKYEAPISNGEGEKQLKELGRQVKPFILRRLKTDVLRELPEKIETRLIAELTHDQKKVYMAFLKKAKGDLKKTIEENGFEKSHIKILSYLTRLRQICCHPSLFIEDYSAESGKLLLLEELIHGAVEAGHRILLFSQFTRMLKIIQQVLVDKKVQYLYLDGSTPAAERLGLTKAFNEGYGKVFLISLKAGGTGLNLTGADTVIHYDPWWNPAVEDQATDRAYRIGQQKSVQVMKLVTKGTIEEKIYLLQEKKKKLIDSVIQPGETMLSKMTREEIEALFE